MRTSRLALALVLLVLAALVVGLRVGRDRAPHALDAAPEPATPDAAVELAEADEPELSTAPAAGPSRAAVASAATAERAAEPEPEVATAVLRVRVVDEAGGAPVAGARVQARVSRATLLMTASAPATTDANGFALLELPAGGSAAVLVSGGPVAESRMADAPARSAGETSELEVTVPVRGRHAWHARVVDEAARPVAGARVRLAVESAVLEEMSLRSTPTEERTETTDAEGRVAHEVWDGSDAYVTVEKAGYGPLIVPVQRGFERADAPLEIRLARGATLEARVTDAGGAPLADCDVHVVVHAWDLVAESSLALYRSGDRTFSAVTDAEGRALLESLPAVRTARVELLPAGGERLVVEQRLALRAGETHRAEWTVGRPAAIRGVAYETSGAPASGLAVWLVGDGRARAGLLFGRPAARATTVTGADGRFAFEGVPPGTWSVAIGPPDAPSAEVDPAAPAPWAEVVEVQSGVDVTDLVLTVHRGLFVSGTVLDADEQPVEYASIAARTADNFFVHGQAREGRFALGPLVPGSYRLSAQSGSRRESPEVEASAGEQDVVLRLGRSARLVGQVVDDASSAGVQAEVRIWPRDGQERYSTMITGTSAEGAFALAGLSGGAYDLVAGASGPRLAVQAAVAVAPGGETAGLVLRLVPAARLVLRSESADRALVRITADDAQVDVVSVSAEGETEVVVPAGVVEVAVGARDAERPAWSTKVELRAGERRELVVEVP